MPNRDEILRELQAEFIKGILNNPLIARSLLKYDADKDYTDPLSIPSIGFVKYLIESGSGSQQEFTEADLIADGFGGFTLPITIDEDQIPVMILIDNGTDKINLVPQYQNGILYGFINNDPQTIIVKIQ